ncbi:efflux RND transporter permease subunit [Cyclobacterium amurskyense]|uniref:RND multidrug efflux transporter n=1 Tax=Cyclobacterium amurskyense TaxID=320787 RepID=A0A0H4PP18_9BACT|nr:efflux RND transporter permease subunit [Cyclobacterium amurskyense]AKP49967.1 RND multidrug efflux transporter [Cyclobacterium amurskyense]
MVKFLLSRPIAVGMTFLALLIFSIILFRTLPISLLPPIDVPQIVIKVNYPNSSPESIEQNVLSPIREGMVTLNGLQDLESKAGSEVGDVRLTFDFQTRMELAYIEVNEKIDRLTNNLPQDMPRPQVVRINSNDIPIVRLQVIPKEGVDFAEVSLLTENVIKKRLEQLEGVALVDINGRQEKVITVTPNKPLMSGLGLREADLIRAINDGNSELPGISVEDGQFRYFLRLASKLETAEDVGNLPVHGPSGNIVTLSKVATVEHTLSKPTGFHLFQDKEGLVVTVHKQTSAKMNETMPLIYEAVELFKVDYPQVDFELTQDQSSLLNAGINNLQTSLLFGGLFAFAILFVFMGNYRTPIIIGISLPSSLVISFMVFYFFDISINVISLSGLALGLGMLIDNAIIVLDNINRKREEGLPLFEACVSGVNEVQSALISSVLTTLAVFVPLVFLSGVAGALFYDQAVSVAAILCVSLLVAFILLPLLYFLLFKNKEKSAAKEDSRLFKGLLKGYKKVFQGLFAHPGWSLMFLFLLIPLLLGTVKFLKVEGLPPIEKFDVLISLDWNEPIDASQNKDRIQSLLAQLEGNFTVTESDLGLRQFILYEGENAIQQADLYLMFADDEAKESVSRQLKRFFRQNYPQASLAINDAPNAFDQLFNSNRPYYEVRLKNLESKRPIKASQMNQWMEQFPVETWTKGPGLQEGSSVIFKTDLEKLALYGLEVNQLITSIEQLFGNYLITDIRQFGEIIPIQLRNDQLDFQTLLKSNYIYGEEGIAYSLNEFITYSYDSHYKYVTSDRYGIYQSLNLDVSEPTKHEADIRSWGTERDLAVDFAGQYFQDQETIKQLMGILMISILLLYFILAAQFESFLQPLIVVFTLPLGVGGAFLVLWLTGTSLNVMSAIGLVVMLGIMVNDAILKIDTINRLRAIYQTKDGMETRVALTMALYHAGEIRLKPIVMTSITTILALIPVVFSAGLGADLQRPLVFSVIGGLTIGTFTALYFVPLAYWFLSGQRGAIKF